MDTEDLAWLNQWPNEKRPEGQFAQMDASAESKHALQTPAPMMTCQREFYSFLQHLNRSQRLTLILPDNTRLALRIKKMEQEENATKLSFRMNLILNGKLKASIE